jgi:predicted nuclease with TOPRIM domain
LCDLRDAVWQLRKEKEEEQQQVQRVQEENGELRQMILQLEKDKDELNKKMEEKEQLDLKEKSNFSCFSRCVVVFTLLGLLFVLKYSTM